MRPILKSQCSETRSAQSRPSLASKSSKATVLPIQVAAAELPDGWGPPMERCLCA